MDLIKFETYEDYLDSFITTKDSRYMRNWKLSRKYIQNAWSKSSMGIVLSRQEFEAKRKHQVDEGGPNWLRDGDLFSDHFEGKDRVLREFARRERLLLTKQVSTIVFLLMRAQSGLEVSGFIDLEQSMREARQRNADPDTDWQAIFQGKSRLLPSRTNLSYCDYKNDLVFNDSDNFTVVLDGAHSLLMQHRGDHKKICVNAGCHCANAHNAQRLICRSRLYGYAIFFDHIIRRSN